MYYVFMLNRLASSNGEITITTSHNANAGPASSAGSAGSGPISSPHAPVKMSPGSVKSPSHDDSDLLADSPSKYLSTFSSSSDKKGKLKKIIISVHIKLSKSLSLKFYYNPTKQNSKYVTVYYCIWNVI